MNRCSSAIRSEVEALTEKFRLRIAPAHRGESLECYNIRQVIIYSGEDGYWVVECPSLPGMPQPGEDA